jgi:carboxyl-terminal processing protease
MRANRLAILLLSLLGAGSVSAGPQAGELDATGRLVVASRIYAIVQQYFAHWESASPSDVDAAYREYIGEVIHGTTRNDFDLATLRFIASLHNGHTQFNDNQMDGRPLKFRLLEVEGRWVVLGSQDRALHRGAVVRTIEGTPVDDFVSSASRYVAASNDRLARAHVFSYPGLFPEQVSVGLQNGDVVSIDRAVPGDAPPAVTSSVDGRWLQEGQVAYVRVSSFGDPNNERRAVDLIRQFAASPNMIVDVRGNGGGTTPRQLLGALMNRPWRSWLESKASRENALQVPSTDAYGGRVFLLVDRFCGSACEDFVMPFKTTGRATLIGEITQGSSGNPYRTDLGHGMNVSIGAVRYRFPDGSPFEGIGIAPDISIDRRIADIVANRDAAMERAQELAGLR